MTKLLELIAAQQKGHEKEPRHMIGEQLKAIAEKEPFSAELLERDLQISEMTLEAAEKHFADYANKSRGKATVFCITPEVAEKLLREFYGLPAPDKQPEAEKEEKKEPSSSYIDLSAFL